MWTGLHSGQKSWEAREWWSSPWFSSSRRPLSSLGWRNNGKRWCVAGAQKLANSVGTRTTQSCLVTDGAQRKYSCCQSQHTNNQRWRKTYFLSLSNLPPVPTIGQTQHRTEGGKDQRQDLNINWQMTNTKRWYHHTSKECWWLEVGELTHCLLLPKHHDISSNPFQG